MVLLVCGIIDDRWRPEVLTISNDNQSDPAIPLNQRHKNHLYSQPTPYRYWLKQACANFNFGWFSLAEAIQECLR